MPTALCHSWQRVQAVEVTKVPFGKRSLESNDGLEGWQSFAFIGFHFQLATPRLSLT